MPTEIRTFQVTIPPGTLPTAPQLTNLSMPARIVERLDIRIPPGPAGMMGFAIASAGQPFIPYNAGAWIVADNESLSWPVEGYLESGAWQLRGYNTGLSPHTIYLTFLLRQISDTIAPVAAGPIDLAQLTPLPADALAQITDTGNGQAVIDTPDPGLDPGADPPPDVAPPLPDPPALADDHSMF